MRLRTFVTLLGWLVASSTAVSAQTIAGGGAHSAVVRSDGTVWTFGANGFGQLGDGSTTQRTSPVQVAITDVVAVAAGNNHTLALKSNGTVWAWGQNSNGQVGDNSTTNRNAPVGVSGLPTVVALAAGVSHSVALGSDGSVWTWGLNSNGQLGNGTTTRSLVPIMVSAGWTATAIGAGHSHTLAVRSDGTLWGWGANASGQLGVASPTQWTTPGAIAGVTGAVAAAGGNCHTAVLLADGHVMTSGCNGSGQLGNNTTTNRTSMDLVLSLDTVGAISAGHSGVSARKTSGEVWSWGANLSGQVGNGNTSLQRLPVQTLVGVVSQVAAGHNHGLAVNAAGVVFAWGSNGSGQLGDGTQITRTTPIAISEPAFAWKVATPTLNLASGTYNTDRTVVISVSTVGAELHYTTDGQDPTLSDPSIASGGSIAVDRTMTLKVRAWKAGMAASDITSATYTMTVALPSVTPNGGTYTSAQTVTLSTATAGAELRYTTDNSTPTASSTLYTGPIAVSTSTTIRAIGLRTGWTQSNVRVATYTMNFGTLAAPTATAGGTYESGVTVTLASIPGAVIRYTTNGGNVTIFSPVYPGPFAITATTTVKAVAYHPDYVTSPQTTAVYTIVVATPVLTPPNGTVAAGQIIGITTSTPGATLRYTLNGATPATTDPIVPPSGIGAGNFTLKVAGWKTGATTSAVATGVYQITGAVAQPRVFAGENHTLAVRGDGAVWSWGANNNSQLGDGTTTRRPYPVPVTGASGMTHAAGGNSHSAALRTDGTVFAWGYNFYGQLGDGTATTRTFSVESLATGMSAIAAGRWYTLALRPDGSLWAWGRNAEGQLGDGTTTNRNTPTPITAIDNVTAIETTTSSSYAIRGDGTLWSWGSNGNGQLGIGNTTPRSSPGIVPALSNVVAVAAGGAHTLALLSDGTVRSWGANLSAQLGDGSTTQRTSPVVVSGLSNIVALSAGDTHSVALASDGTVWAWGANTYGQIGDGTTTRRNTPVQLAGLPTIAGISAGHHHTTAVATDGSVWVWGRNHESQLGDGTTTNRLAPTAISGPDMAWLIATPALSVAPGVYATEQTVTVTNADPGAVMHYTTGGADPLESDPVIASGATVTVDRSLTLKVRAWKPGSSVPSPVAVAVYELKAAAPALSPGGGTYSTAQAVTITTATPSAVIRYTLDGTTPDGSSPIYTGAIPIATSTTVFAIATRANWSSSDTTGATYTLNFGTLSAPAISPAGGSFAAPATVTMSASEGATIRYTTNNTAPTAFNSIVYSGPFVVDYTQTLRARAFRTDYTPSTETSAAFTIALVAPTISLASGTYAPGTHVTITHPDPAATLRLTISGSDPAITDAEVASGTTILVGAFTLKARAFRGAEVGPISSATFDLTGPVSGGALSAGGFQTGVATPAGRLYTWGDGCCGQIGDGNLSDRQTPTLIQSLTGVSSLAMGRLHTVASTADGKLYAWGASTGDGTTNTSLAPQEVPGLTGVAAVAAGHGHTLVLTSSGHVYAWGENSDGQLGLGHLNDQLSPVLVPGLTNVTSIAVGAMHSLAVTESGTLYAWGDNGSGQLGDGTFASRSTPTAIASLTGVVQAAGGGRHTLARLANGDVYAWGQGLYGQLGLGEWGGRNTPQRVAQVTARLIAAGGGHSLAVGTDGVFLAWGDNSNGQLGDGTATTRNTPVAIAAPAAIAAIAAGTRHSAAITLGGDVWTWGDGQEGQLGDDQTHDRFTPALVLQTGSPWQGSAAPVVSPGSGIYHADQFVTVSAESGATVRYTTNGLDPTESDPVVPASGEILVDRSLTLKARAWPSGVPGAVVTAAYVLRPLAPGITPGSGTYSSAQQVTLQTATAGASIRYTLDGSEPTETSTLYSAPFTVASSATVKARAFRANWDPSATATAVLTLNQGVLGAPVATPAGGTYATTQHVTLTAEPGAAIRYTTDGSTPTAASPIYSAPIAIGAGWTTLRAKAYAAGWTESAVLTENYTVSPATLTVHTYALDDTAPGGQGAVAGGVYIRVNGRDVGQTDATGTLVVQVPPGDITVTGHLPSEAVGGVTVTVAPGGSGSVTLLLDSSKDAIEQTSVVLAEAADGIVPVVSPTMTFRFMKDGAVVPMTKLQRVELLNDDANFERDFTDLFAVSSGVIASSDTFQTFGRLSEFFARTLVLYVEAEDAAGFTHGGTVRFRVGQYRLALQLAPPPSNVTLPVSNIAVKVTVSGTDFSVVRTSDADGRLAIEWMPHATLTLDAATTHAGLFYYGEGTIWHIRHGGGIVTMRYVSDVLAGVPPLTLESEPMASMVEMVAATEAFQASDARKQRDQTPGRLEADAVRRDDRRAPPQDRASRSITNVQSALEEEVSLTVTAEAANVTMANSVVLNVPQGTSSVTLSYDVASLEYPEYVEQQSVFDDLWSITVFGGPGGQQLFATRRNVNSQLYGDPAWQPGSSTGSIEEEIDVEDLTAEGDIQLTLYATAANIRDHLLATSVSAQLKPGPSLTISSIQHDTVPAIASNQNLFYSIPRPGQRNHYERWYTLQISKPADATLSRIRLVLRDVVNNQMQQLLDEDIANNPNVQVQNNGNTLKVRATMHTFDSQVPSTPPNTGDIRHEFVVEADVNGDPIESPEKASAVRKALWRMPDGFGRYGARDVGGDNWASIGAYDWLVRNSGLITRIDDISGEHGRNIGHNSSHGRGRDIDLFHVYTFPNGGGSGAANYARLAENVVAAIAGDAAAEGRVDAWISETRARIDAFHALGDVQRVGYAIGSTYSRAVSPTRTITLTEGWARSLLEFGTLQSNEGTWNTGAGQWSRANDPWLFYNAIHNSHLHVELNERMILR